MITIILLKPETSANIGFISRAMANFDLNKLILIDPKCNHLDEDALKISKHSKNILKKAVVKPYDYFNELKKHFDLIVGTTSVLGSDYNLPRTPLTPQEFVDKIDEKQNIVLIFGNEGTGLSNEEIKKCDFLISIPTSKKYSALNISHAAAILFYEIYKKTGKNKINSHIKKASAKEREIILSKLNNIINSLEFTTEEKRETQRKTWKNLIGKSMMSKREAFSAIGLLKKIEDSSKF